MIAARQAAHPTKSRAPHILATNVVVLRARHRFSQVGLAERAGVSRVTISRIERGEGDPKLAILERIAAAFGVGLGELFAWDGDDIDVDGAELARRAADPNEGAVEAWSLLAAIDEAAGHDPERYSTRGRPRMARSGSTPTGEDDRTNRKH